MPKIHFTTLVILVFILIAGACKTTSTKDKANLTEKNVAIVTVDQDATAETRALYHNLLKFQDDAIMFGHQDDLAYGIGWWADDFRSDVHDVCGKFPAVFGWDAG